MRFNCYGLLAAGQLALVGLASCASPVRTAPTLTAIGPVSFANKDLSKVVLQASDLPGDYVLATQLSSPSDLAQVFGDYLGVHTELLAGQEVAYAQGSRETGISQVFNNAIFVFSDEAQASQAFQSVAKTSGGATLDFPALGSESVALHRETPAIGNPNVLQYTTTVVWRQNAAVILLDTAGSQVPTAQMAKLAQNIQGRILQK